MNFLHKEKYKKIKLLGQGSFGKAFLVECIHDGSQCVIKEMDLKNMSESEKKDTVKEAQILRKLSHPYIIEFKEVFKKSGKLCIVMDFADGGDLSDMIKHAYGSYFKEGQILDWFCQLCLAIKHVHDRKIIHRDLKTQNVFMTKDKRLKLGDFGIARVLSYTHEKAKTMVGTPYYLSPEIVENKPYNFKSDIWSLGVVLYELCALKPPFDGGSLSSLALCIVQGRYKPLPKQFSRQLSNLIARMLEAKPNNRPTINEILQIPLVKSRINKWLPNKIFFKEFSHTILHNQKLMETNTDILNMKEKRYPQKKQKLQRIPKRKQNPDAGDYRPDPKRNYRPKYAPPRNKNTPNQQPMTPQEHLNHQPQNRYKSPFSKKPFFNNQNNQARKNKYPQEGSEWQGKNANKFKALECKINQENEKERERDEERRKMKRDIMKQRVHYHLALLMFIRGRERSGSSKIQKLRYLACQKRRLQRRNTIRR